MGRRLRDDSVRCRGMRSRSKPLSPIRFLLRAGLTTCVHHKWRRLVVDEILEPMSELVERDTDGGGKLRKLVRILEIVAAQADHVASRNGVPRGTYIDEPHFGAA